MHIYIYVYIYMHIYAYIYIYVIYAINMQKTHSNTASQYNSSSFTGDTLRQGQQGLWTRPGWLVTWGSPISSGKTRLENHFDDKHLYGKQVVIKQGGWKTTFLQQAVICLCWSVVVVGWYLLNPQLRWLCLLWPQLSTCWTNGMLIARSHRPPFCWVAVSILIAHSVTKGLSNTIYHPPNIKHTLNIPKWSQWCGNSLQKDTVSIGWWTY